MTDTAFPSSITGTERYGMSARRDAVAQVGRLLRQPAAPVLVSYSWVSDSELALTWEPQPTSGHREQLWYLYQDLMTDAGLSTELGDEID